MKDKRTKISDNINREFEIDDKDKVYYFEDVKENLKISKELYNWSTVLIDPTNDDSKDEYIDYTFKTIEDAMTYFNLGMTNKL